ncbi:sterol 14-alpha-demethylase [Acrasis kona]|uniref:Sterol 14-alpha-demethylase n=1 Tax=Acrasis kona TaxID=1008807 RepID=A0AAW2ZIJ3_9EUKA
MTMFVLISASLLALIFVSYCYHLYKFKSNDNFKPNAPPVVTGRLPYLGDLQLFGPGLREYLERNRKKLGDIYTVYVRGQFWTFIFGDEHLKTFFTSSEKVVSSFEFLYQMLEPMQPIPDEKQRAVNGSLNFVSLNHKILNKTNHLQQMVLNNEYVCKNLIEKEWFGQNKSNQIDVFRETYRTIFMINILNFGGRELYENHGEEIFNLWEVIDYSRLNIPKEMLLRKLPSPTPSQVAYQRLQSIVSSVMKQRENKVGLVDDILDAIMAHVRTRIIQGDMPKEITEIEAVSMQLLNMFVASHITTSNTVGWLIVKCVESRDEKLMSDLRREASNAPSPITLEYLNDHMPVTDAAITESVRFSLLGLGGRLLMQDVKFGSYTVPKGNIMYHPYYGAANHFTNSSHFDPYRYFERQEHLDGKDEFKFTPFGAGKHPCAGKSVAKNVAKAVMIELLKSTRAIYLSSEVIVAPTCLANFNRQVPEKPIMIRLSKA